MRVLAWGAALAILTVTVLVALTLARLDSRVSGVRKRLASRLYLGIPWGTFVVVSLVGCVYLFVQHGISSPTNPVVIPYRAWSYQYPLGMVAAPFSHASLDHLLGNLTGALVLSPIAEYAWGHYPRETGDAPDSPGRWISVLGSPRIRAFVLFPLFVCIVSLATSIFAVGPVIGFSGVVFAFAGFAMVHYPIATIVASLGVHGAVYTLVQAVRAPITVTTVQGQPPAPPSWATIAIQAHALGFLLGVLLAVALLRRTDFRPDPVRFWIAVVLFGFSKSLWAIYWYGGDASFVLFRAPGVILVLVLATVVTAAVTASDRPLVTNPTSPSATDRSAQTDHRNRIRSGVVTSTMRVRRLFATGRASRIGGLPRRETALTLVLVVLALISGPALALNAVAIDPGETEPSVTVDSYAIAYEDEVENQLLSVVPIDAFGSNDTVTASGIIVWSTDRPLWTDAVSADRLAYSGTASVQLGGIGWRETVTAERTGWSVVGNGSAYQVWLESPSSNRTLAHESDPQRTSVEIDGVSFTLASADGSFVVRAERNGTVTTRAIPDPGTSISIAQLQIVNRDDQLIAEQGGTQAVIASVETYN